MPLLGYLTKSGSRGMIRFEHEPLEKAAQEAEKALKDGVDEATAGFTIVDGYFNCKENRSEALLVEARVFDKVGEAFVLVLPYRNTRKRFTINSPKFILIPEGMSENLMTEWLLEGVSQHEKGAKSWRKAFDDSK